MSILDGLNEQQRAAVQASDGPLMIIAGPGTGKTKTLVNRIRYLIESCRAQPQEVLALTFTKKAAGELCERINIPQVYATTFHGFCHELLGGKLQFASEVQQLNTIRSLRRPEQYRRASLRELALLISRTKNRSFTDRFSDFVEQYNAALLNQGLADFDDLLIRALEMLQAGGAKAKEMRQRFRYVLIDEFQDTNQLQYALLKQLVGHENLFVIGDPHQSIYGFRGASGDIFSQFARDFPNLQTITLQMNYRSSPEIVALANRLAGGKLIAQQSEAGSVRTVRVLNEYSEAAWVVGVLQQLIGGSDFQHAISDDERSMHHSLRELAILYRSRSVAKQVQRALTDSGIPFQVVGDGSPYEEPEVQLLLTLLHACQTNQPAESGALTLAMCTQLLQTVDSTLPPLGLTEQLIEQLGQQITPALRHFMGALVMFISLDEALGYFDSLSKQQFYDPRAEVVTLMTIHAAKGLEFSRIFLLAAEEGILPYKHADRQEEARLLYVAVTRAKHQLDIIYTGTRHGERAELSSFLATIDNNLLPREVDQHLIHDQRRALKRHAKHAQMNLFSA